MSSDQSSDFSDEGRTAHVERSDSVSVPNLRLIIMGANGVIVRPVSGAGPFVIGRAMQVDITIEDQSVSRQHARLHLEPELSIEDLGSRNGTRIGGVGVEPGRRHLVSPGDFIEVGTVAVTIQRTTSSANIHSLGEPEVESTDAGSAPTMQHRPGFVAGKWLNTSWGMISRIARGSISVLLRGETGVGKEILAELIHEHSRRSDAKLVRLNCAALPENMIESEIFGHEKGSFTGAHAAKQGLLEVAHGGTLFLDEIGELPAPLQAKLLRAIEDGSFRRVGSTRDRKVDVRFISATNVDLEQAIAGGSFRSDLLYRLNAFTLAIPPLRRRQDEIEGIALALAIRAMDDEDFEQGPPQVSSAAMRSLQTYHWPGNIRELRNVMERAVLLCDGKLIEPEHLPQEVRDGDAGVTSGGDVEAPSLVPAEFLNNPERERIVNALRDCGGNQTRAAEALGISRRTLTSRLSKYRIPRPRGGN
jgi:DNA-binding NtrC family response regulator